MADTRDQVAALNAAIRDHRLIQHAHDLDPGRSARQALTTGSGERIGAGDTIATRRNDRALNVANRQIWTVTGLGVDGTITVADSRSASAARAGGTPGGTPGGTAAEGSPRTTRTTGPQGGTQGGTPVTTQGGTRAKPQVSRGERTLPSDYVQAHVELAYARTVYGAQGETVDAAHFVLGEQTGAASAYVAMTRGRHHNTAHLVAETLDDAREQWVAVFSRDRADLGPARAADRAAEDLDRYGSLDWESAEALAITESSAGRHHRTDELNVSRGAPELGRRGPAR